MRVIDGSLAPLMINENVLYNFFGFYFQSFPLRPSQHKINRKDFDENKRLFHLSNFCVLID